MIAPSASRSKAENIFTPQNWNVVKDLTITIGSVPHAGVTVTLTASGSSEYNGKTQTFKVFNDLPPTATIGDPGPNNVITVTFSKAVGPCSNVTQGVCSTAVTAFTTSNVANTFELVVGSADHKQLRPRAMRSPSRRRSAADVATIAPTVAARRRRRRDYLAQPLGQGTAIGASTAGSRGGRC